MPSHFNLSKAIFPPVCSTSTSEKYFPCFFQRGKEVKKPWTHDKGVWPRSALKDSLLIIFGVLHRQENICFLTDRQMALQTIIFSPPDVANVPTVTRTHTHMNRHLSWYIMSPWKNTFSCCLKLKVCFTLWLLLHKAVEITSHDYGRTVSDQTDADHRVCRES